MHYSLGHNCTTCHNAHLRWLSGSAPKNCRPQLRRFLCTTVVRHERLAIAVTVTERSACAMSPCDKKPAWQVQPFDQGVQEEKHFRIYS